MALGTLAELRSAALGLRTDLSGQFGDFLALAEQRMFYGSASEGVSPLRVLPMETTVDVSFTAGVGTLPTNYLDKRALYWEGTYSVSLTYEPPSLFYPLSYSRRSGSLPEAYTVEGNTVKISPALTGTAKMLYFARPAALSADPDTNAILTKWPGIYLFGCQIEMYRVLRDDAEMIKAARMYADAVSSANSQTITARAYGGPMRRRAGFAV